MSRFLNSFLCGDYGVADGAVAALGKTGLCAGGRNSLIGDNGVSRFLNSFLCGDNCVADGAVAALGKSRLCAGGRNSLVCDNGVSLCGYLGLLGDYGFADRAVAALGKTRLCAGCRNSLIGDNGVRRFGGNCLLDPVVAACAVCAVGKSRFGACGGFALNFHGVVTERGDRFRVAVAAAVDRAGVGAHAAFRACSFGCYNGCVAVLVVAEKDKSTVVFLCVFLRGGIGVAVDDCCGVDCMRFTVNHTVGVVKRDFREIGASGKRVLTDCGYAYG